MNDSKKSQSGNPLFDPLVECFGRAGLTGLASFWFVFSTSHFLQKPLRNRLGYPVAGSLILSTSLAGAATYFMTEDLFAKCSCLKAKTEASGEEKQ